MKSRTSIIWALLALLAALVLTALLLSKEGGCDRADDDDDDDMEPACKPGDKECHAGKPAPTPSPPIGGAR